jgi:hypothetical protein
MVVAASAISPIGTILLVSERIMIGASAGFTLR